MKTKTRLEQLIPDEDTTQYLGYINDAAIERYGMEGGLRFYEGVKETFLSMNDHTLVRHPSRPKKAGPLSRLLLLEPIHLFLTIFDRMIAKSKHRMLSVSAGAFAFTAYIQSIIYAMSAISIQTVTGVSIERLLGSVPPSVLATTFLAGPASSALLVNCAQSTLVSFNKVRNNGKDISIDEIESDIRRYADDFRNVWQLYSANFASTPVNNPSIAEINGMYILVTARESISASKNKQSLKLHERSILDTIERVYGKQISSNVIFHPDIRNIGGVTLLPSVVLACLFRPFSLHNTYW